KGSGTLNKTDLGGITLVRDDYTFTGPLNIQGGSVRIGDGAEGGLTTASSINIGGNGALWIRRTDGVNASAVLPSTITFAGANSIIDFNPPDQNATITLDRDLGDSTATGAMRVSGG